MKNTKVCDLWLALSFCIAILTPGVLMALRPLAGQPIIAPKVPPKADPLQGELQLVIQASDPPAVGAAGTSPAGTSSPGATSRVSRLSQINHSLNAAAQAWLGFRDGFEHSVGGRDALLALHSWLKIKVFNSSPSPLVVLGKNGWLYYTGNQAMEGYRGANPFTEDDLERLKIELESRRARLHQRGIAYLFVVPPDKQTMYPEFVPDRFTRVGPSRLAQLSAYLKTHSNLDILDLSLPLLAAKKHTQVYYQTDTHWNRIGAFIGYQQIMQRLQKFFPKLQCGSLSDYVLTTRIKSNGDLARLIGLENQLSEKVIYLNPRRQLAQNVDGLTWGYTQYEINTKGLAFTSASEGAVPRVVIFHDSFFESLAPLLAQHFQRVVYCWSEQEDMALLDREHPDLVIDECTERFLGDLIQ
ncbi:MAG: hypothetical protein JO316_21655 [Abitibacteriaceae bacterium]|nr:hypothetical protein [Abditibacteriaceae bacterium]